MDMKSTETFTLSNGLRVTLIDLSRNIAADRFLVKIECRLEMEINQEILENHHSDGELVEKFLAAHGPVLSSSIFRERNFIGVHDVESIREDMITRIHGTLVPYLSVSSYPEKALLKAFEEFRKMENARSVSAVDKGDEEDDEPADFSHCFK